MITSAVPILRSRAEAWQLALANTALVGAFLKGRGLAGHPAVDDLFSEGVLGLLAAAERFDPSKGYTFATYSRAWVWQKVGRALRAMDLIRLPAKVAGERRAELREKLKAVRVSHGGRDGAGLDLEDRRAAEAEADAYEERLRLAREAIGRALDGLPPRHAEAVRAYYLDGGTLADVGARLGCGKENARQLLATARRALRRRCPELAEFLATAA